MDLLLPHRRPHLLECFVQVGLHLFRVRCRVRLFRHLLDLLPAGRPGVDPPLQRVHRRVGLLCLPRPMLVVE